MCRGVNVSSGRKIDVFGRLCVGGWSAWDADEDDEMASVEWSRVVDVVMYRADINGTARGARGARNRVRAIGRIMIVCGMQDSTNGHELNPNLTPDLYTRPTAQTRKNRYHPVTVTCIDFHFHFS